jgi:hypothetical protein
MSRAAPWVLGVLGLAAAAAGWLSAPPVFLSAWLAAETLLLGWCLGSLALLLVHTLTGGAWGLALRPALLRGICALPLLVPAAVPFASGLGRLYGWARATPASGAFYLQPPFFWGRFLLSLAIWLALGALSLGHRRRAIAPVGLALLALTASFAAIDTTMSLTPGFVSSAYGMTAACGMVMLALALAVLATPLPGPALADPARLLLALVALFLYLDFMQFLIIWQSGLASEARWYLPRAIGLFGTLRLVLFALDLIVVLMLMPVASAWGGAGLLRWAALLVVAGEILRAWWLVLPAFGRTVSWIDLACMAGTGGLALGFGRWAAGRPFVRARAHA